MRRLDHTIWIPHTTWHSKQHKIKRAVITHTGERPAIQKARGQSPTGPKNPMHHTCKHHHQPRKAATTNSIYPSPHGSQMKGRAPSLLTGALGQQGLELSHLLVEHVSSMVCWWHTCWRNCSCTVSPESLAWMWPVQQWHVQSVNPVVEVDIEDPASEWLSLDAAAGW